LSKEKRSGVAPEILARLRLVCLDLPDVIEEKAWAGIRWSVAKKNFAHVLTIADGWPPAYVAAAGTPSPACVLTFRLSAAACHSARFRRAPFFRPVWFPNIAGVQIDSATDWDELDELIRESFRVLAPKKLIARMSQ
jgi:hypothetical protein